MKTQGGRGICKDSPKEHKLLVWPKWANGVVGPNPSAHISMSLLLVATQLGVIEEPFEIMSNAMNHPRISVNLDFLNVTFSCVLFYYVFFYWRKAVASERKQGHLDLFFVTVQSNPIQ